MTVLGDDRDRARTLEVLAAVRSAGGAATYGASRGDRDPRGDDTFL